MSDHLHIRTAPVSSATRATVGHTRVQLTDVLTHSPSEVRAVVSGEDHPSLLVQPGSGLPTKSEPANADDTAHQLRERQKRPPHRRPTPAGHSHIVNEDVSKKRSSEEVRALQAHALVLVAYRRRDRAAIRSGQELHQHERQTPESMLSRHTSELVHDSLPTSAPPSCTLSTLPTPPAYTRCREYYRSRHGSCDTACNTPDATGQTCEHEPGTSSDQKQRGEGALTEASWAQS